MCGWVDVHHWWVCSYTTTRRRDHRSHSQDLYRMSYPYSSLNNEWIRSEVCHVMMISWSWWCHDDQSVCVYDRALHENVALKRNLGPRQWYPLKIRSSRGDICSWGRRKKHQMQLCVGLCTLVPLPESKCGSSSRKNNSLKSDYMHTKMDTSDELEIDDVFILAFF